MNLTGHDTNVDMMAEQSVLGAVLLKQSVLDKITFLEPRDFSIDSHQKLFEVMRYMDSNSIPIDIVTVTTEYLNLNKLADPKFVTYITELAGACPTATNVKHYAKLLKSKAIRRRGKQALNEALLLSEENYESDEEYYSAVESVVASLRPSDSGKMQHVKDIREGYFEHLTKEPDTLKTGFIGFDDWAGGVQRGWLYILAGRPSAGKTAKVLQMLLNIASEEKGAVLFWSQEMSSNKIMDRWISSTCEINFKKFLNKQFEQKDIEKVRKTYDYLSKFPIHVQDSAGITIDEVFATAKNFKRRGGKIAAIAVDYLQIMSIPQKNGERRDQAIGRVTTTAKRIARELDCCFIMLSQMTRDSESAVKPQLSHLKESSSIEQDADVVEFLWHDPNDVDTGGKVIQSFIAKGRDTGINDFRLLFKGWIQRFTWLPNLTGGGGSGKKNKK
ncbi:replicative DNA helicase [Brevibacillus sp. VP]|uniref:replicative DNA helicase n=1 Tax=Brevibacillus sp. VP TaxID=2293326 RepID=UPI000E2EE223|nr:DnaB-like helicase C-terminal domain-containing protein [Brevibacillus sp. VP]RFB31986.1 replicative DNA helicase [Brevibacillus sp. VP]